MASLSLAAILYWVKTFGHPHFMLFDVCGVILVYVGKYGNNREQNMKFTLIKTSVTYLRLIGRFFFNIQSYSE